ncbi:MAG TPA: phosphoribosyltransferase family protein [Gemmatales bacterium]|nr:phosphoribosyltransferase family protein [Gemmatales bacterium]
MFHDRAAAARQLLPYLKERPLRRPVVLAIPRGGLALGVVLAQGLAAELDVVIVRKIPLPGQPEAAIGAVAEDGTVHLHPQARQVEGVTADYLRHARAVALRRIEELRRLFRQARPPADLAGRSVIVVDDGIATGATMLAALIWLRSQGAENVIVAVPVAAPDRLDEVAAHCDDVLCLRAPEQFRAVGEWYEDFRPVGDEEAVALLAAAPNPTPT